MSNIDVSNVSVRTEYDDPTTGEHVTVVKGVETSRVAQPTVANRLTIEQGTDAAMAVLAKIGAGTVPGTSSMPAQLATLLSFLPANDTAATTAAHGLLMIRAEAKLTRLLVRLVRGDFSGTA